MEPAQQYTVRLDFTPPPSPALVQVLPEGWTRFNSFHVEWPDGDRPLGHRRRVRQVRRSTYQRQLTACSTAGSTQINDVKAPNEGRHSVYVWLRDGAGNADFKTAVAISDSVWYDGTPPTSVITPTAASGLNGWYRRAGDLRHLCHRRCFRPARSPLSDRRTVPYSLRNAAQLPA